ncbi:MAG: aldolase/citrate lyase family protein [Alphaproteobacteria bacterium]
MKLRRLFALLTGKYRSLNVPDAPRTIAGAAHRHADIILCNDATELHRSGKDIEAALQSKGYDIDITCVSNEKQLLAALEKARNRDNPPNAIFMDVGGVGAKTARKVIKWYDRHYPDRPLPALNFLSLSVEMGISEAGQLRNDDARVLAGFVDECELTWLKRFLMGESQRGSKPASSTFREVLNEKLGLNLPLDKDDSYYKDQIKRMTEVTKDRVLEAWQKGKLPPEKAVEAMRGYALGLASSFLSGLYMQESGETALKSDAAFYGSAGFPAKGPAVFSIQEAESSWNSEEKPVLFMQSYDPAVAPLLASGQLGGLVVTSPYMASHLKLLCETHMVSGLFGMMPPGEKTLTSEFNEEAKPDLPPFFDNGETILNGRTIKRGQMVLVANGGNGIVVDPPASVKTTSVDFSRLAENSKLLADIRNMKLLQQCFDAVFRARGVGHPGVKSNVDACNDALLEQLQGIGLVRTEQLVATNGSHHEALKSILLKKNDDGDGYDHLFGTSKYYYSRIIDRLDYGTPVKFRLFDFVHREILDKDEQKEFVELYGKLDIHGGEALETWPRLYVEQVRTIFAALKAADPVTELPLEIMMPAVRTEKDVLDIKKIVEEEAKAAGIEPRQYSFGVMVETLQSCENISAIAKHCDFISFGTNDLTQEYFNMARSDLKAHANFAGKNGFDPFKKMAPDILNIIQSVVTKGREANKSLRIDVCGAQAADPDTAVALFKAGVDNISVAPSLGNLFGLPALLNYRAFDAMKGTPPAPTPASSPEV